MGIWNDDLTKIVVLPSVLFATRLNSQNRNETSLLKVTDTLMCVGILLFPIGIIEVPTPRIWRFFFISVPYTITELQVPETLKYIPRGSKWSDVKNVLFSSSKCEKKKNLLKPNNQVRNRLLLSDRSSSMKEYTCHYGVST